ncbi:MAG: hypothetical protein Q7K44_00480 [Candidatus Liptonbacteria bacterium]|nr:hypothetical protein [Candidatus Liptonbacteria bacterium]
MNHKILLLISFFIMLPLVVSADVSLFPTGYWGPLVSCYGIQCNTCHLFSTAQMVIYFIMTLTIFVIGPLMITAGGIMMLISAGNAERFSSGRKMATGAVIGILIGLGAFLIVNTLLVTVAKQIPGFSGSGFTIQCAQGTRSPFVSPLPRQDFELQGLQNFQNSASPAQQSSPQGQTAPPAQPDALDLGTP